MGSRGWASKGNVSDFQSQVSNEYVICKQWPPAQFCALFVNLGLGPFTSPRRYWYFWGISTFWILKVALSSQILHYPSYPKAQGWPLGHPFQMLSSLQHEQTYKSGGAYHKFCPSCKICCKGFFLWVEGIDDLSLGRPDPWGTEDRTQSQAPLSYSRVAPSDHN